LKRHLDRVERDHNLLRDRVLLLTLNRVPAQAIGSASPEQSDGRPDAEIARTENHAPTPSEPHELALAPRLETYRPDPIRRVSISRAPLAP
jgi:hypothetical protein